MGMRIDFHWHTTHPNGCIFLLLFSFSFFLVLENIRSSCRSIDRCSMCTVDLYSQCFSMRSINMPMKMYSRASGEKWEKWRIPATNRMGGAFVSHSAKLNVCCESNKLWEKCLWVATGRSRDNMSMNYNTTRNKAIEQQRPQRRPNKFLFLFSSFSGQFSFFVRSFSSVQQQTRKTST